MKTVSTLLGVVALAACSLSAQSSPGMLVDADWLTDHLDDPGVVLLHAEMRPERYEEGHIPGARLLDLRQLVWEGDPAWETEMRGPGEIEAALEAAGVGEDQHIVVYAQNALFAARAWMTLDVMGLGDRTSVLDGGLSAWREAGGALSTEAPRVALGSLTLTPRREVLVGPEWILERLDDPRVALVDARPDDEYTGADGGMGGRTNPGHIPGARQMYWEELIVSRDRPTLRAESELRALFEAAGAVEGGTNVAYCMVGWRASMTYFVSRLLGYETRFYDGSWHEWGSRSDLPYVEGRSPR